MTNFVNDAPIEKDDAPVKDDDARLAHQLSKVDLSPDEEDVFHRFVAIKVVKDKQSEQDKRMSLAFEHGVQDAPFVNDRWIDLPPSEYAWCLGRLKHLLDQGYQHSSDCYIMCDYETWVLDTSWQVESERQARTGPWLVSSE